MFMRQGSGADSSGSGTKAAWLVRRTATASGLSAAVLLGSRWIPTRPGRVAAQPRKFCAGESRASGPGSRRGADHAVGHQLHDGRANGVRPRRRPAFTEGLVRVDALLNATNTAFADIRKVVDRHPERVRPPVAVFCRCRRRRQSYPRRLGSGWSCCVVVPRPSLHRYRWAGDGSTWLAGMEGRRGIRREQHWDDPRQHGQRHRDWSTSMAWAGGSSGVGCASPRSASHRPNRTGTAVRLDDRHPHPNRALGCIAITEPGKCARNPILGGRIERG